MTCRFLRGNLMGKISQGIKTTTPMIQTNQLYELKVLQVSNTQNYNPYPVHLTLRSFHKTPRAPLHITLIQSASFDLIQIVTMKFVVSISYTNCSIHNGHGLLRCKIKENELLYECVFEKLPRTTQKRTSP